MKEKYGFVYIWRDRKHKRYYIGAHWGTEDDGYICSSTWMLKAHKKRSKDFKRRIIKKIYTNKKDLFVEEQKYLDMIKKEELGKKYYNLNKWNHWLSDETKSLEICKKISIAHKNKIVSEETKDILRVRNKEQFSDPLKREKHSKAVKFAMTLDVRKKISQSKIGKTPWNKGIPLSKEQKLMLSKINTGKKHTSVTKEKLSKISKGRTLSSEHRIKLSFSAKNRKSNQLGAFWWNNGIVNKKSINCPGQNFVKGRIYNRKESAESIQKVK